MSTQADRRRQIDNKNARQASGRAMRDDMRALSETPKIRDALPVVPKRGSMVAARGTGAYTAAVAAGGGGGGIASPLVEESFADRLYHDSSILISGDFLLGIEIKPISEIKMTDADGEVVVMRYADPSAAP